MKTLPGLYRFPLACGAAALLVMTAAAQGPLAPPGAPGPTMRTLQQVEPRIPIDSVPHVIGAGESGSYYLTGNMTVTVNAIGIAVNADNVTVDLNGFTLAAVSGNTQPGISTYDRKNIRIMNGTIQGFGNGGVQAYPTGKDVQLHGLTLRTNQQYGAYLAGESSQAAGCTITDTAGTGILAELGAIISGNVLVDNAGTGIKATGAVIRDNNVSRSGGHGIDADASMIIQNMVLHSVSNGITCNAGTISQNVVMYNNKSSATNGAGICAVNNCRVTGNTVLNNNRNSIYVEGRSNTLEENLIYPSNGRFVFFNNSDNWIQNNRSRQSVYWNPGYFTDMGGNHLLVLESVTVSYGALGSTVPEGTNRVINLKLTVEPPYPVTVNCVMLALGDPDITIAGGASLAFTPENYDTYQPLTVQAAEDPDAVEGSRDLKIFGTPFMNDQIITLYELEND